jgi:Predicted permease
MQILKDLLKDKKLMKYTAFIAFTAVVLYILFLIVSHLNVILAACGHGLGSIIGAFSPLFIGMVLAYILCPAVEFINRKFVKKIYRDLDDADKNIRRQKKQRLLSAAITYLGILAAVILIFYILATLLLGHIRFESLTEMIDSVTSYVIEIEHTFKSWAASLPTNALSSKLDSLTNSILGWMSSNFNAQTAINKLATIGSGLIKFLLGLLVSFWFVYDKDFFMRGLNRFFSAILTANGNKIFKDNMREIDSILSSFIRGVLIDSVIIAILSSITLTIIGLKYAVIIGIFAGISNIIPYFGPIMGMIPAFIVGFINGGIVGGIIPVIGLFIVQQIDSNFIYPKVVGTSTGLHPVTVLLAVVAGGVYGGIVGMLIAVPCASIIKLYAIKIVKLFEARKEAKEKKNEIQSGDI